MKTGMFPILHVPTDEISIFSLHRACKLCPPKINYHTLCVLWAHRVYELLLRAPYPHPRPDWIRAVRVLVTVAHYVDIPHIRRHGPIAYWLFASYCSTRAMGICRAFKFNMRPLFFHERLTHIYKFILSPSPAQCCSTAANQYSLLQKKPISMLMLFTKITHAHSPAVYHSAYSRESTASIFISSRLGEWRHLFSPFASSHFHLALENKYIGSQANGKSPIERDFPTVELFDGGEYRANKMRMKWKKTISKDRNEMKTKILIQHWQIFCTKNRKMNGECKQLLQSLNSLLQPFLLHVSGTKKREVVHECHLSTRGSKSREFRNDVTHNGLASICSYFLRR